MKKTYKSSLLALSVLASFTSCSESESLQQANLSKDKITFHATLDNSWNPLSPASSSRAAIAAATEKGPIVVSTPFGKPLYLHPVVQDGIHIWSKEGKPITRSGAPLEDVEHERVAQTRGTMSTKTDLSDYNSFGVTAIYKVGENNLSLFQEENGDPKIAVATSTTEDKVWEIKDSRWPVGSEVSFHAFAPYSADSTSPLSFTPDVDGEKTQIKYTALTGKEEIKAQPDLILATAKGSQSENALGLNFSHALTAVTFAIDKDLADVLGAGKKLTSITLSGIPNEGTYNLAVMKGEGNAAPEWQFAQDGGSYKTVTYTFDLKDQNIVTGKDFALTSDNNTLMMIPQTLPESAKLNFQFELDGVLQSLIIDMKDQVWQPGKSVIYKLSAKAINTLSNPEVVYPDTWTAVGYPKQLFNDNEAIGLYAVSKDGLVVIPNVKLTKGQDGSWKTENDQRFLFTTNYSYFAYYPYRNSPDPLDVNVNATTADEFFKDMITNWNPVKEQPTEDVLLKQDLQVAKGVIKGDASTLTFNMAHSMGLAVLNLKAKMVPVKRTFTTNNYTYYYPDFDSRATSKPATSEYTNSTTTKNIGVSTQFKGNIPYSVPAVTNRYLQIVKPNINVAFTAAETSAVNRDGWGILEKEKNTFNVDKNSVSVKDITSDAEFYYFARKYTAKDKYEDNKTEKFTVPVNGDYKLQCWGASGWYDKGLGGYVEGSKDYSKGFNLYICVGGTRNFWNNNPEWNGLDYKSTCGIGGGCTSITTTLMGDGQLKRYSDVRNTDVVMVAGGGGGFDLVGTAGSAGGEVGQSGSKEKIKITGGTQTEGGTTTAGGFPNCSLFHGNFGFGGCGTQRGTGNFGGQGGGGWYGGGGSCVKGGAGGGSSYFSKDANLLKNGKTIAGYDDGTTDELQPTPDGTGTQRGHLKHGVCIITQTSFK